MYFTMGFTMIISYNIYFQYFGGSLGSLIQFHIVTFVINAVFVIKSVLPLF